MSGLWFYKKRKQDLRLNASKKQALTALENNPDLSAKECIALLKWAAMQYVNRQQLAKLYGEDFQYFLKIQLPEKYQEKFYQLSSTAFLRQYQAEQAAVDIDHDCQQATKLWLNHALPIKEPLVIDKTSTPSNAMPVQKEKELS